MARRRGSFYEELGAGDPVGAGADESAALRLIRTAPSQFASAPARFASSATRTSSLSHTHHRMADSHLTELSFSSLHLPETLQKGLADASFERCTPIQAQTLPQALAGLDVAGQAQTGTGKTAAFLVAMYARLIRGAAPPSRSLNAPRALIVAPTRELAVQIHRDAEVLGSHTGLHARARVRRRRLRQAAPSPRAGRRRSDRHARPHHRFRQAARDRPALGAGAGAR